jgi:hypothetical protein
MSYEHTCIHLEIDFMVNADVTSVGEGNGLSILNAPRSRLTRPQRYPGSHGVTRNCADLVSF